MSRHASPRGGFLFHAPNAYRSLNWFACSRVSTRSPREREVLEQIVAGQLNKQIADDLGITEATVKMHRTRVMAKMKVQSVAELARLVERCGARGTS